MILRVLAVLVFLGSVFAIDAGVHRYFWVRLFRDPAWPPAVQELGAVALIALAVLLPLGMIVTRLLPRRAAGPIAWLSFVWMGSAFYLLFVLLLLEPVRALAGHSAWPPQQTAAACALAALALSGAVSIFALLGGLQKVSMRRVEITLPGLPKALDGFKLVQLSDVHVGPTLGRSFVASIVARANAEAPDAVVITGDLVDGSVRTLLPHVAPLAELTPRCGTYFITGNHEYYSGVYEWERALAELGIKVLRNEHVSLTGSTDATDAIDANALMGTGEEGFDLAGIDDVTGHAFAGHGPDIDAAVAGRDESRLLILLAHQPRAVDDAVRGGAALMICGHTHGGQMWPFNHFVKLAAPYVDGLHQHNENTQVYVSRGTGYWGPPMRLLAPAEITTLILRAEKAV